ncbi:hypothetical protein PIROE2DRAFT_64613 [Piromyces sp. E2]|nr:hypothetical protein PIROE2DRAFT_64613 [Piromyces sp. E2]|eukprot:OUM58118.1 hypothetical protein PIROE2DRAFT_64613 [Piromyces sp. E2]
MKDEDNNKKEHDDIKSDDNGGKVDNNTNGVIENKTKVSDNNEKASSSDNINSNLETEAIETNQEIDSKIKNIIPTNFEVLIEVKEDKRIDFDEMNKDECESVKEIDLDHDKEKTSQNSNNLKLKENLESTKNKEKEKELIESVMKYFSIIESSLDTLHLFSIHLNEEATKDNRNNSVSKPTFNAKIVKRIVNYSYQLKDTSTNQNTTSMLKFVQILEKIMSLDKFNDYLVENPKIMVIICKILNLCFSEFSFIKDNIHIILNHYERNIGGHEKFKKIVRNLDTFIN